MDEALKNPFSIGENKVKKNKPVLKKGRHFRFHKKISLIDKMFFARHLALMMRAGIPITRAMEFLFIQVENARFREIIASLSKDITAGTAVADSMAKYPEAFDPLFVNMVASGETGGNLEEVLDIIAEELEKSASLRSKVVGAMIYPMLIIGMMVIVCVFIVFFVFPKIIKVYESLNVKVPVMTKVLIGAVLFITNNSKYIGAGGVVLVIMLVVFLNTNLGRRGLDRFVLYVPVMKMILRKVSAVTFSRTLSSLLKSGLSTPEALEVTAKTFTNSLYQDFVMSLAVGVRQGRRMSDMIINNGAFLWPATVGQMVSVGEETGVLSDILKQLSVFFEAEVDNIINNLTKIIEPILMIVIGSVVGFIAVATVQLIYASLQGVT